MPSHGKNEVLGRCRRLAREMGLSWQCLPGSPGLAELPPVDIQTCLVQKEGRQAPSTTEPFSSPQEAITAALEEADPPVVILLGESGAGKTAALMWTVRECANRMVQRWPAKNEPFPIYIDLGEWVSVSSGRGEPKALLDEKRPSRIPSSRPLIWFLDGMDVLPTDGPLSASAMLRHIREVAGDKERFVVSGRPTTPILRAAEDRGRSCRLQLQSLDHGVREEWVKKHCPDAAKLLSRFEAEYPGHATLLNEPLFFVPDAGVLCTGCFRAPAEVH